jgi:hypothetical protein
MANRQEIVCTYIYENYVASGRLRHDVVSNKVQIAVMGVGGDRVTGGHPFPKTIHTRVCVRFINKGVRRSTRPPKNFRLLRRMLCGRNIVHCAGLPVILKILSIASGCYPDIVPPL